jgi:multisubunit Na+/H+ antiporter MnhF subunit
MYARPHFLDIALVYALINFIAALAFLKYVETGGLD